MIKMGIKFLLLIQILCSLFFSSCAVVKFQSTTAETQPYYLNHKSGDEILLKKPVTLDFYFWGLLPPKRTVYLEDHYQGEGLTRASSVEVKMRRSFLSYLLTFSTLGLYYPVDVELSLYAKKSDSSVFQFEHPILEVEERTP